MQNQIDSPAISRQLLRDLKSLRLNTIEKITTCPDYSKTDIVLTQDFKNLFSKYLPNNDIDKDRDLIDFAEYTTKVTKKSGLVVYIPNVWFVLGAYVLDFYKELGKYQEYFIKVTRVLGKSQQDEQKKYANELYEAKTDRDPVFHDAAIKVFSEETIDISLAEIYANRLWQFVSNQYSYWATEDKSGKKISRSDFRASSILSLLNLVQADQGYVTSIVDVYAKSEEFKKYYENPALIISKIHIITGTVLPTSSTNGRNLVVYGTPGCGKSYYVEHVLLPESAIQYAIRTTFYQDYTYTDFVGQILPEVHSDGSVSYQFNPGPFTQALELALKNSNENVALIIEELNRGNAASIFGDIFQLLDRNSGNEKNSVYSIQCKIIQDYLKTIGVTVNSIRIPANLSIYATMNTSDQNVFTLDTAFKRRWEFKKLSNEFTTDHPFADSLIPGMGQITWKRFINTLNQYIISCKDLFKSEDKLLGVYFVSKETLADIDLFAFKIFEYLWDDVFRNNRGSLFRSDITTLDVLLSRYKEDGVKVFNDEFLSLLNKKTIDIPVTDSE